MVSALNVGNTVLNKAFAENIDITPMKLQKIIYFIYRDYLKKTNDSLFDERFAVWKYGPVIPSIYTTFKHYGSNAIKEYATENDGKTVLIVNTNNSPNFKGVIENVWENCKYLDGIYLSSLTHQQGSACRKAYDRNDSYLSDEDIKSEEVSF